MWLEHLEYLEHRPLEALEGRCLLHSTQMNRCRRWMVQWSCRMSQGRWEVHHLNRNQGCQSPIPNLGLGYRGWIHLGQLAHRFQSLQLCRCWLC